MLNTYYTKLLKLLFVVLLATVCIIGFTGNTSYAFTYEEFENFINNHIEELPTDAQNRWNWFVQYRDINSINQYWNNNWNLVSVHMASNVTDRLAKTFVFSCGYYNNNDILYHSNKYIYYTPVNDKSVSLSLTYYPSSSSWTSYNVTQSNNNYVNDVNDFNKSYAIVVHEDNIYTSSVGTSVFTNYNILDNITYTVPTVFEKINSSLNYSNNYTTLGKMTGEDIHDWRIRAILYQNGQIVASYNEIGLGGIIENGLIARRNNYNLQDNDIYISVRSSLLYPNKEYSLDVYYDEDDSILSFNETYNFSLSSGDSSYTSQNSTNDIINNQNQNTNDIINAIESGNNNVNDFLTAPLNLSGENISSGDIIGALDMNFSGDPYQNVWTTLIDGLRNCLVGVDREFDIEINNKTYTISLDSFSIHLPAPLKIFLTLVSTSFMIWVLIRWIKLSIDKVQTANVDNLLQLNEEERHY